MISEGWLIDWLIDWLVGWLIDGLIWLNWSDLIWSDLIWFDLMWFIWFDFIPLCLNRKFRNPYRSATPNAPTSKSELFSKFSLVLYAYLMLDVQNRRFRYRTKKEFRKVKRLKYSLGKSGRFRTSGNNFWSRITGSRFGSVSY